MSEYLGWIGLGLGLASRVFVPWLNKRRLDPDNAQWAWRYVWPQLIGIVTAALLLPLIVTDLESVGSLAFGASYVIGWGAADIGRQVDKFITKD